MTEETSLRYPVDERYWALVDSLVNIRRTNPEASPYLYAFDGTGELAYVTSWAARGKPTADDSPAAGVPYLIICLGRTWAVNVNYRGIAGHHRSH